MKKVKNKKKPRKTSRPAAKKTAHSGIGITPVGDRVLVRPLSPEESGKVTSFGIIIPDTVDKKKPEQGIVVAVGPGKRNERGERITPSVKEGDKIYFSKPWEDPHKIDGIEYYFIAESDILAVITK